MEVFGKYFRKWKFANTGQNQFRASSIIPRIHRIDLEGLSLSNQSLTFADFNFFASSGSLILLSLDKTIVKNDDGTVVPIEKLIELSPELLKFEYLNVSGDDGLQTITSETAEKLVAISHFRKIEEFAMDQIPESFHIDVFFATPKVSLKTVMQVRVFLVMILINL